MPAHSAIAPSEDMLSSPATDPDSEEDTCPPADARKPSLVMPLDHAVRPSQEMLISHDKKKQLEEYDFPPENAQEPSLEMRLLQAAPAATPKVMLVHMLLPAMLSMLPALVLTVGVHTQSISPAVQSLQDCFCVC